MENRFYLSKINNNIRNKAINVVCLFLYSSFRTNNAQKRLTVVSPLPSPHVDFAFSSPLCPMTTNKLGQLNSKT